MIRSLISSVACIAFFLPMQAQIGSFALPGAGLSHAQDNPAIIALDDLRWNIHLGSASLSGQTNYGFIQNDNLIHLGGLLLEENKLLTNTQNYITPKAEYYDRDHRTFAKGNLRIGGPAFSFKWGDWQLGLLSGVNLNASATAIPTPLGYYNNYEIPIGEKYELNKGRAAALLWTDIGIHISRGWQVHNHKRVYWGLNIKYLNSFYAIGVRNEGTSVARKLSGNKVAAVTGLGEAVLSDAWQYQTPFRLSSTGSGMGVDLGFIVRTFNKKHKIPIEWGGSISNLGLIKLSRDKTTQAKYNVTNEVVFSAAEFQEIGYHPSASFNYANEKIRSKGNSVEEQKGSIFYTPARFNAFLSVPVAKRLQSQITWQQNLAWDYRTPASMNHVSLTTTYHLGQLAIGVPISLMNYRQLWTGLSVQLGPIIVGTDRLFGSVLNIDQLDAASLYFSIQLNENHFRWLPEQKVKCPKF